MGENISLYTVDICQLSLAHFLKSHLQNISHILIGMFKGQPWYENK